MSRGAQEVIEHIALSHVSDQRRLKGLNKVKAEVSDGKSLAVSLRENDVIRLVSLIVVRIKSVDGRIFAQVGKWDVSQACPD